MLRSIIRAASKPVYKVQRLCKPCRFVFLLVHARCGSTLLSHILSSNPDITGFGETFLKYRSPRDLDRLIVKTSILHRRVLVRRYTMDKVAHNGLIGEEILRDADCRFIFLIREPERAIPSLFRQLIRNKDHPAHWGPEEYLATAVEKISSRIRMLVEEATAIDDPRRRVFLTYDQLMSRTAESFQMLEDFLELDTPLSEEYALTKLTGQPGGDTSQFIKKGYIDRSIQHEAMSIDPQIMEREREVYESVRARLSSLCRILPPASTESPDTVATTASNGHSSCCSPEDGLVEASSTAG